jgi:hypothetical protein
MKNNIKENNTTTPNLNNNNSNTPNNNSNTPFNKSNTPNTQNNDVNTPVPIEVQQTEIPELEGRFRYTINYCCCCSKLIVLQFILTKSDLLFYSDEQKTKIFLTIPRSSVIAINKRQIDKYDVYKFSIYYKNPEDNIITEIKLKTGNKTDTDRWISTLRRFIQPKRYIFKFNNNEITAEELFPFKDTKKLYLSFCHLEYILLRGRMSQFFVYFRKLQKEKWNKNNDSYLFEKKDENEKFISNKNIELNDIDVEI